MTRILAGIYYSTPSSPQIPLTNLASRLRTEVVDLTATHTLTQVFCNPLRQDPTGENPTPHIREAKYTFPLYESCAVTNFSAQIGSKFITGVVKPKKEAKAVYEAAKAAGKQAALLEQNTAEVFTTNIGNILPGQFVVVVIKYVHELKQDIEVEGVRLVIPTIIAPKYGDPGFDSSNYVSGWENGWNTMGKRIVEAAGGRPETRGLAIEVVATMNGSIRGIQSPSHPISVNIGSHDASGQGDFNSKMARATLAVSTTSITGLDKDFTLVINSTDISLPRAFLAPHPTLPSTSTLLVTLAPRFELPQQCPEVVFIVDRSGSMYDKIKTVRSALHLFLASLPVGVFFNIVSFGNNCTSLWDTSQSYNAETLELAKRHVDAMESNMGGTEMRAPCEFAINRRRKGMNLEALVLTDGEIWNTEPLFEYINNATSSGDARFFSLGVGESVSHLLVEGISRAGKGYSQIVGLGENMQKKIMRMLKASLTPHVNDWSVDWDGRSEIISSFENSQKKAEAPVVHAPISLFDPSSDPDNTTSTPSPSPIQPPILQSPSTIPPLFPFTRTTVYTLLTEPCTPPTAVHLLGNARDSNTNSIHPLKLTIPVTKITTPSTSLGLYSLLGRKLLQDLEEGRCGYIPSSDTSQIEAEGTRLGVKFGLASKWTSFVAVASGKEARAANKTPTTSDEDEDEDNDITELLIVDAQPRSHSVSSIASLRGGSAVAPQRAFRCITTTHNKAHVSAFPPGGSVARTHSVGIDAGKAKSKKSGVQRASPEGVEPLRFIDPDSIHVINRESVGFQSSAPPPPPPPGGSGFQSYGFQSSAPPSPPLAGASGFQSSLPLHMAGFSAGAPPSPSPSPGLFGNQSSPPPQIDPTTPSDLIAALSRLQLFSGLFLVSAELLKILGLSETAVNEGKQRLGVTTEDKKMESAFITCIVLAWLRIQLKDHEEEWELMAGKAKGYVEADVGKEEVARIEREAETILGSV